MDCRIHEIMIFVFLKKNVTGASGTKILRGINMIYESTEGGKNFHLFQVLNVFNTELEEKQVL